MMGNMRENSIPRTQASMPGRIRLRQALKPYAYFIPALLVAYLFSYRPFLKTLANSVSLVNYSGRILEFVGLENYRGLFADKNFQTSLINTFRFTALFVPIDVVFCLVCALLVYRKRRFNALNETLFILPMAVAMTSAAIAFRALFNPTIGVINHLLGIQIQWFNDPAWAMTTIVVLSVWMALGFDFLLLLAALRSVPRQLVESAQLEGAGRGSIFLRIQLPLISPTLLFIVTTRIRDGMLLSGPVLVMTEGGPFRSTQTLIYQMYIEGFKSGNYSMGSAISVVVFVLTFTMILLAFRIERKGVFYQ